MDELGTINTQDISLPKENNTVFTDTRAIENIVEDTDFIERKLVLSKWGGNENDKSEI